MSESMVVSSIGSFHSPVMAFLGQEVVVLVGER